MYLPSGFAPAWGGGGGSSLGTQRVRVHVCIGFLVVFQPIPLLPHLHPHSSCLVSLTTWDFWKLWCESSCFSAFPLLASAFIFVLSKDFPLAKVLFFMFYSCAFKRRFGKLLEGNRGCCVQLSSRVLSLTLYSAWNLYSFSQAKVTLIPSRHIETEQVLLLVSSYSL